MIMSIEHGPKWGELARGDRLVGPWLLNPSGGFFLKTRGSKSFTPEHGTLPHFFGQEVMAGRQTAPSLGVHEQTVPGSLCSSMGWAYIPGSPLGFWTGWWHTHTLLASKQINEL